MHVALFGHQGPQGGEFGGVAAVQRGQRVDGGKRVGGAHRPIVGWPPGTDPPNLRDPDRWLDLRRAVYSPHRLIDSAVEPV